MKMLIRMAALATCIVQAAAADTPSTAAGSTLLGTPRNVTVSGKLNLYSDPPMIGTTDLPIAYQYQMANRIPANLHVDPHEMPVMLPGLPQPAKACFAKAVVTCQSVELWKVANPASPIVSVVGQGRQCKIDKMACIN